MEKFIKEGEEKPMASYEIRGYYVKLCESSIDKVPYKKEEYLSNFISGVYIVNR